MSDDRRPPRIVERDRRRFTPDGRPRAEPGGASGGEPGGRGTKPGEPAPAEPRPAEEPGPAEETGPAASGASRPKPAEPPAADAKRRPAASSPKPDASAGAKRPAPPAETAETAPPEPRAGNEGREHLVGFLLTLAETYLRVLAARAAEPVGGTGGGAANRKEREGQDPAAQAFVGLEQVVSYFRLLTDTAAPPGSAGAEAPAAGDSRGDPRLQQLVQLLLAHADYSLRAAAAPPPADPRGGGEAGSGDAAAALRGAEALGAFQEVIGMLEALEQHTRSGRTEEESRMMSRALYQMRMDYLALAGAPGGAPAVR